MRDDSSLQRTLTEGIATVTLNRPDKLNALSRTSIAELIHCLDELDADDAVRAVIITGAGRAFCAGADLSSAGDATFDRASRPDQGDGQDFDPDRDWGGILTLRLFSFRKPVIAAVNGPAVGIGATLMLPADIRIASTNAKFGFVFARRGILPDGAASWFLPRVVGISTAVEWCYSGRLVTADEALARGLVRSIHAPEELLAAAHELALSLCRDSAPVSVALTRQLLWRMLGASHPMEAHRAETLGLWSRGAAPDAREGVSAFLEKRPPSFTQTVSNDLPDIFPDWKEPSFRPES